jgi:Protein of unknown function (DUF2568)
MYRMQAAAGEQSRGITPVELTSLVLRVALECGIVAGLAYWGVDRGGSTGTEVLLGIGAPVVGFGFWGAIDFHQAGRLSEPLRLVQELVVSGLAALALWAAGRPWSGLALALLSVGYHAQVYASGARLLKPRPDA